MTAPRIVTYVNDFDPIIPKHLRWTAYDARRGDGPDDPVGRGATEAEAIDDLLEQLEDGNDD